MLDVNLIICLTGATKKFTSRAPSRGGWTKDGKKRDPNEYVCVSELVSVCVSEKKRVYKCILEHVCVCV